MWYNKLCMFLSVYKDSADIIYMDPPYNTRQYASNYHLLETMALYDNPILHEKNVDSPQPDERIIALARYVYEEKIKQGENPEDARVEIMNSEPFNRYPKFNLL